MEVRGLIFDYGGTLDTGGCHWARFFWHAYEALQAPVNWQQFSQAYVHAERSLARSRIVMPDFTFHRTLQEKIRLQLGWLGEKEDWRLTAPHCEEIGRMLVTRLYERVRRHTAESAETLRLLSARYPMVLVSNFYGNLPVVLHEFALDTFFTHVVESAAVGVRKPNPQIFRLGVEKLGLPAQQVLVVGDSIDKDILPARQIGCQTVWLKGEGWSDDPGDGSVADYTIGSIGQLPGLCIVE